MNDTNSTGQPAALPGLAEATSSASLQERRRAHVANVYADHIPARSGWVHVDPGMRKIAPDVCYNRGDGWWTLEQAFCFASREELMEYASSYYSSAIAEYHELPAYTKPSRLNIGSEPRP